MSEMTNKPTPVEGRKPLKNPVAAALAFFASCIRSGEEWDDLCQEMYDEAIAALSTGPSHGTSEADFIATDDNACPACGGSGHKDDALSAGETPHGRPAMAERQEVEALLALAEAEKGRWSPHVPAPTLAALCRAWLAVDSGIHVTLNRNDVDAMALPDSWSGQLVRIVKEPGET